MTVLGVLARWIHLASTMLVFGTAVVCLLAGRPSKPSARAWEQRVLRFQAWCLGLALAVGVVLVVAQITAIEGYASAALDPDAVGRALVSTRFGAVWLVRHGVLLALAWLTWARLGEETEADRLAQRLQSAILGGVVLGAGAWAGHSAEVEPWPLATAMIDALHRLATGVWFGGLLPLALLLRTAARPEGADARPYAVLAARRFSTLGLGAMVLIALSGTWNAWTQLRTVGALVGTPYGRALLVKLWLVAAVVAVAAVNRRWLIPALAGDGDRIGRPAMRQLARLVGIEGALGLGILGLVAWLAITPPGRHVPPTWPLPFRLSYGATADRPGVAARIGWGGATALVGLAGLVTAGRLPRRRLVSAAAIASLALGGFIALPPLVVAAYPTTYRVPPIPYQVQSIATGAMIYGARCLPCHTADANDLLSDRTARHTAGDLFWWLTAGVPGTRMPAFGDQLSDEQRWDLVTLLRARAAGAAAQRLGASVEPPTIVAPDFQYAVGPTPPHSLRDDRGQKITLLVLFTLPESRPRLRQLAQVYDTLARMGVEVIAVSTRAEPDILRRLGADPLVVYPVVTDGARDLVRSYQMFAPGPPAPKHLEFLIDRQGYLRARMSGFPGELPGLGALLTQIQGLNLEPQTVESAEDHLH